MHAVCSHVAAMHVPSVSPHAGAMVSVAEMSDTSRSTRARTTAASASDASFVDDAASARRAKRPRWFRILLAVLACTAAGALVSGPWWGPLALSRFDYFHVRRIEFEGLRYARAAELVSALRVDTTQSVWQAMGPLSVRVAAHPIVASAEVERRLPGTLIVHLVERVPVALAPVGGTLRPTDGTGHVLPIDPARVPLDMPIAATPDTALLRVLDALRQHAPLVYARMTDARRVNADELQFNLGVLRVRTADDVTVARFRDILPVEADLARNHLRAVELDLRFRDQVIVRQP